MTIRLKPVSPFRLDLTAWALRRRSNNMIDRWDGETYRRLLPINGKPVDITVRQSGTKEHPEIIIETPEEETAVTATVERMLGTRKNLTDFYRLASSDPQLSQLAGRFCGLKPPRFPTLFEALVNGIACQQITLTLGIHLLNRLAENFGLASHAESAMAHAFPMPQDLAGLEPHDLRRLGFSFNKATAIIELARMIISGQVDLESLESHDDKTVFDYLCQLKGVGRWTAEYVMLRGLGRIHIFPGDDVGARKKLQRFLKFKEPIDYNDVKKVLSKWKPYGGFLYFHLLLAGLEQEVSFGEK